VEIPDVHYARSGDVSIAYQIVGEGPVDLVFVRGFAGDLLSAWEQPLLVRFIEDLASFARVIMLDKRGTGLSDRVREVPTLETRMDDLRAVMDAVGSDRAIVWTAQEGARLATLFAATYPERAAGLVLFDPSARGRRAPDYPWAPSDEEWRRRLAEIRDGWGTTDFLLSGMVEWAPSMREDESFCAWFVAHMRRGLSPGSALAFFRMMMDSDVSDVLPAVRVPTVILATPSQRESANYFAQRIKGARVAELPRDCGIYHWIDQDAHAIAMRETRLLAQSVQDRAVPERVLATVLFTDLVGSTERASELGDRGWRELLGRHHAAVRRCLAAHGGAEIDVAGDGFLAVFNGPGRAIGCACSVVHAIQELGLGLRAGVHTGECERVDERLTGIAVNVGARVAEEAGSGQVLVSSTVRDLVAGSGIQFEDRGEHELKGAGRWHLYSVVDA
jgi:class 3 adenylate cyclase